MLNKDSIKQLEFHLKKIFALPVTRSTLREVQNAIALACGGKREQASALFESLASGTLKEEHGLDALKDPLTPFLADFHPYVLTSKEVFERAEFVSFVSADLISQQNQFAFLNRIRRVDGKELQYLSDIKGFTGLLNLMASRLGDLKNQQQTAGLIKQLEPELRQLKAQIDELLK